MSYKYLSHIIDGQTPIYGNGETLSLKAIKIIKEGDTANTYRFDLSNHTGTHIDAPNHFFDRGKKISDYDANFWIFKSPAVINVKLKPGELLTPKHLTKKNINKKNDILIIKSGWSVKRKTKDYVLKNPGIHPDTAEFLRKHFPGLRAVGIDWISISSFTNRELGRQTHKIFLNPDKPILLIEDMDLTAKIDKLSEIFAFPVRIKAIDSAPCTVIGRFK